MDAWDIVDWRRRVVRAVRRGPGGRRPGRRAPDLAGHPRRAVRDPPRLPAAGRGPGGFGGLPVPAYDPAWRFEVEVRPAEPTGSSSTPAPTGRSPSSGSGRRGPGVGSLDVWRLASYGGGLFVPVKDASAGTPAGPTAAAATSLDTVKGADLGGDDGTLVLDFNFAYNPSCAYDPAWACPLAQPGNTVGVPVPVGSGPPAEPLPDYQGPLVIGHTPAVATAGVCQFWQGCGRSYSARGSPNLRRRSPWAGTSRPAGASRSPRGWRRSGRACGSTRTATPRR